MPWKVGAGSFLFTCNKRSCYWCLNLPRMVREKYPRRPNVQFISGGKHSLNLLHSRESLISTPNFQTSPIPKVGEALSSPRSVLNNDIHSKRGVDEYARPEHGLLHGTAEIDYIVPCYFGDDSGRFIRETFLKAPHTNQWRRRVMSLLSQGKDIVFSRVSSPELEMNFTCKAPKSMSRYVVV